jgi:NADP-dependent 3-hydroxy acid dehydrogenase YdfG
VVLAARNEEQLRRLEKELDGSIAMPTDVTNADQATTLIGRTVGELGRVDVLVNSAGRAMAKPVELIDLDEYRDVLELNVVAPLRLMQLAIPPMRQRGGGAIINLSSQASTKYIPFIAGYASTKSALNTLSLTPVRSWPRKTSSSASSSRASWTPTSVRTRPALNPIRCVGGPTARCCPTSSPRKPWPPGSAS